MDLSLCSKANWPGSGLDCPDAVASGNRGTAPASCGVSAPTEARQTSGERSIAATQCTKTRPVLACRSAMMRQLMLLAHQAWADARRGGPAARNAWCGTLHPKPARWSGFLAGAEAEDTQRISCLTQSIEV